MKKETIIWQVIVLILGFFMIFTIKTYLENNLALKYENNRIDNLAKRASCFMLAQEKDLGDVYCQTIDTTDKFLRSSVYQKLYK